LSDDNQRTFREVQAFFRLPSIALVEKDLFVVRAIPVPSLTKLW
jgi:hypothetical protein